jgi:F1F0 ATPase subunit 2
MVEMVWIDGQTWIEGAIAGAVIGLLYFGGLWLTVERLPGNAAPLRVLILSGLVRLGICLVGFGWVMTRSPLPMAQFTNLLIAFLALLLVRTGFTIAAHHPNSFSNGSHGH